MNSLREELLGIEGLPTMRVLIPAGWRSLPLTEEGLDEFALQYRTVLMRAHRPDLDAELTGMLQKWARELREEGGRFAILPSDVPEGSVLPMSVTLSVVSGISGRTLDEWVTMRIRQGGTSFLDDRRTVLAWQSSASQGEALEARTHTYLIPVPATKRSRAVLLSGVELVSSQESDDTVRRDMAKMLFDSIALALDWMPAA